MSWDELVKHFSNQHKINKSLLKDIYAHNQVSRVYNKWVAMSKEEHDSLSPAENDDLAFCCKMCGNNRFAKKSALHHF